MAFKFRFTFFCAQFLALSALAQLTPIGQWRVHLPMNTTLAVAAGNDKIYAATPTHVFSVDADRVYETFTKANGLNDIGISTIAFDATSRQLLIAYKNSNIDLLNEAGTVININDIKRSTISGDKTINHVFFYNDFAYLSTGLGIVVVDVKKLEVKDTYFIGANASKIKVNGFARDANFLYAATANGLKRCAASATNPADFSNWSNLPGFASSCEGVWLAANNVVVQRNQQLWNSNNTLLYADVNFNIEKTTIDDSKTKLLVCHTNAQGASKVVVVSAANGALQTSISRSGVISFPKQALLQGNTIWVSDLFGALSEWSGTNLVTRHIPNGPFGNADGDLLTSNGAVWFAAGSINQAWNYQYNRSGIYRFEAEKWDVWNGDNVPLLRDTVLDFITLAADPAGESIWAGSYSGGLLQLLPTSGQLKIFKQNSSLQAAIGDPLSYRVSGLAFDNSGNLWIANFGAPKNLSVRKPNGQFLSFAIPFFHTENAVGQIVVDDEQQVWVVSPKGNGVFCYNPGSNIDGINDDKWRFYKTGRGNGNLPTNDVFCLAKDQRGDIWVGTAKGVGIISCVGEVFGANGCEAVLPIVQQDRFAGYLLSTEEVRHIVVDGANRKWVATSNGVYLLSADGDKTIYRFTEDNSPLLSNDAKKIAIDSKTGEVFFATFKGICSFRSTATAGELVANEDQVLVFPNPVPPGYGGTIAIRGLVGNSTVKITELNGRLVFQTRALGGQAIWNGKDYKGQPVASGVYLVLAADEANEEKLVTKIVVAR
jgi:streptogramin lyase